MILIISNESEFITNEVIRWLNFQNKEFIRISEKEEFEIKVHEKRVFLSNLKNEFFLDEIKSVWYRRGRLRFKRAIYSNSSINHYMAEIQHWLEDYVMKILESKRIVNKQTNSDVNKLWVLEKAKEVGLDVPTYFLTDNLNNVDLGKTISKTMTGSGWIKNVEKGINGLMYTAVINQKIKESFFLSFVQEKIEKDFEIRSFYLNGKVWSTALFSQGNNKTAIDFRNYEGENPSRNVRYNLPRRIEEIVIKLMIELDLNSGSLDFIKKGEKFYFLEVNPIGQFIGFGSLCNYYLEKEIAEIL